MNDTVVVRNKSAGVVAGIIACVLAVVGILFFGTVFVPLAAVVALVGSFVAVKHRSVAGIGVNVLAWVLILAGLFSSPLLLALLGLGFSR